MIDDKITTKRAQGWFKIREAAKYASVSQDWLRRRIYAKVLPATNIASKTNPRWRIKRDELDQYLLQLRDK